MGDPDCSPPDTCFVNIVPTPDPMAHVRMGGAITASWRVRGAIARLERESRIPPGSRGLPSSSTGSGPGQPSLEGNPLVTRLIGINAPFQATDVTGEPATSLMATFFGPIGTGDEQGYVFHADMDLQPPSPGAIVVTLDCNY
jgi:hypothetical protein